MRDRFATRVFRSFDSRKDAIAHRVAGWKPIAGEAVPTGHGLSDVSKSVPALSALHVLVVDNDIRAADSLELLLHAGGYPETRVAYTAHGALAIAKDFCPAIVLMELDMRDMGSEELTHTLKERARLRRVRLIAVSNARARGERDDARIADFERCLRRPISAAELALCLTDRPLMERTAWQRT